MRSGGEGHLLNIEPFSRAEVMAALCPAPGPGDRPSCTHTHSSLVRKCLACPPGAGVDMVRALRGCRGRCAGIWGFILSDPNLILG